MVENWGVVRARLLNWRDLAPDYFGLNADIRAALKRVEELEREKERITSDWAEWEVECSKLLQAAEAKLARVVEACERRCPNAPICGDQEDTLPQHSWCDACCIRAAAKGE